MSRDLIVSLFDSIDARDWDRLKTKFCADATYERPGYAPLEGLESILHFYREVRIIVSGSHKLDQLVVEPHAGASWGRYRGKSKDGADLDERFADVYTFEDGKIKHRISYFFRPAI